MKASGTGNTEDCIGRFAAGSVKDRNMAQIRRPETFAEAIVTYIALRAIYNIIFNKEEF